MSPVAKDATPVVVLRSGHHGGLGIVRSLGRAGVRVYCVDADWWEPAFTSRYCRRRFLLDLARESNGGAGLQEIARQVGGRPILMPTTDETSIWVAENAAALRSDFRFPDQNAFLVKTLCDKNRMQELARRVGVPVAQSLLPRSKEDVARFAEGATFPVMVKEAGGGRLRSRAGGTKFLLHDARELSELYARVGDPETPNLIIQEFIPGEDWMFNGYFDADSRCLFGMTGTKIRRFPVNTGVTSLGMCLANETIERTTIAFAQAIGYHGILDIGYRRDRRDGRYKVLDVNPRIGCTFRLFTAGNGLDVARALYLDMTGQPVPPAGIINGRKWLVEDFDLISAFRLWQAGALSLKEWIRSWKGVRETACFAPDDSAPFLMMVVTDVCELYRWKRTKAEVGHRHHDAALLEPIPSRRR